MGLKYEVHVPTETIELRDGDGNLVLAGKVNGRAKLAALLKSFAIIYGINLLEDADRIEVVFGGEPNEPLSISIEP
jgi:hypothetical protein